MIPQEADQPTIEDYCSPEEAVEHQAVGNYTLEQVKQKALSLSRKHNLLKSKRSNHTTHTKPLFQVNHWNAVASWTWDGGVASCAICRNGIMGCCIKCTAKTPTEQETCVLAWGVCNHVFHYHCIMQWLSSRLKTGKCCPLCNTPWTFQKLVN